jgi:hypothetical protein
MAQIVMLICRDKDELGQSHSCNFDHRRRPETFRTAMATAFFCPTNTTSFFDAKAFGNPCFHQLDDARDGGFGVVRLYITVRAVLTEVRDRAPVDAMGAGDDAALCGLSECFGEAPNRHRAG